jgi:hypothetical protein
VRIGAENVPRRRRIMTEESKTQRAETARQVEDLPRPEQPLTDQEQEAATGGDFASQLIEIYTRILDGEAQKREAIIRNLR